MTQDDIDTLYGAMCKEKKGSKGYWEAKSNYFAAMADMYNHKYISLRDELDGTPLATVVEERDIAQRNVKNMQAQLDDWDHDAAKEIEIAEDGRRQAESELIALYEALGMSELDWEHAKAHGKLPGGQLLIVD
jgi:hypothetical protein